MSLTGKFGMFDGNSRRCAMSVVLRSTSRIPLYPIAPEMAVHRCEDNSQRPFDNRPRAGDRSPEHATMVWCRTRPKSGLKRTIGSC